MINLSSLLASTTNTDSQGPNMPKYGFAVLMTLLVLKTCACLIQFAMLPILKMRYKKAGEIIRQGPYFDHIMLQ